MFSILYSVDGTIYQIGPFASSAEAINAALEANENREFNILDTRVYLLYPGHNMVELCESDLVYTEVQ